MKENKFIEKFKQKTKSELIDKIENSSLYEQDAIKAAKYILENYSDYENENENENENEKFIEKSTIDFQYKEKAYFKSKWIYRIAVFYTFISMTLSFWASDIDKSYDLIIWSLINLLFLIVIISKHPKTLLGLKILSGTALCFMLYRYMNYYLSLVETETFSIQLKDIKYSSVYLFIIFGGKLMIENRMIKIKKRYTTMHKKNC